MQSLIQLLSGARLTYWKTELVELNDKSLLFLQFQISCNKLELFYFQINLTDRFQVQGSRFKGCNQLKLKTILIKMGYNQNNPLDEPSLSQIEDKNPLILAD